MFTYLRHPERCDTLHIFGVVTEDKARFKLVEWAIVVSNICNICTEIPFVCFILFSPVSSSDPVAGRERLIRTRLIRSST